IVMVLIGCQTSGRRVHSIPVARDYSTLGKTSIADAAESIEAARLLGAAVHAPYEFYSACNYLAIAREQRRDQDRKGVHDYAGLAKQMADAAARTALPFAEDAAEDTEAQPSPQERFEQIKQRHQALNQEKAIQVAPVLYAHLTAALSSVEHDLLSGGNGGTSKPLDLIEADLDALLAQDVDEDGIPDMADGAPWRPEDRDRFEDDDGVPDTDNDADGVPDAVDIAPDEPETLNGWHDADGAPDELPVLDPVQFVPRGQTLRPEAKAYLRGIKQLLLEWPELKLRLCGYCNPVGSESRALDLSRRRAELVQSYLVELGVPEGQLVVTFLGASDTPGDARTSSGRKANARVDLAFE
ncbi:MAG: OmpA family protein, partial [Nitrospiraceae bacterium]|nr:OmpA family protein [Nitrospiraceae bacterium]